MSKLLNRATAAMDKLETAPAAKPNAPARAPVTSPGAAMLAAPVINELTERAEAAEGKVAALSEQLKAASTVELPHAVLVEVPGRRRKLSDAEYAELRENLRNNPMVHPVRVRPVGDGRYEIISGANRRAIYEELGRETVPVDVRPMEEEVVDRAAFYANLLQTSLPDYEKYLGFRAEQERTGATQAQMAANAGVGKSVLSMLFSFGELPAEAQEVVAENPRCLGMSTAAELARAAKAGKHEKVIEAVKRLASGQTSQREIVRALRRPEPAPESKQNTPQPVVLKQSGGRSEYCRYIARGATIRIDFKSEGERERAEAAINAALRTLSEDAA